MRKKRSAQINQNSNVLNSIYSQIHLIKLHPNPEQVRHQTHETSLIHWTEEIQIIQLNCRWVNSSIDQSISQSISGPASVSDSPRRRSCFGAVCCRSSSWSPSPRLCDASQSTRKHFPSSSARRSPSLRRSTLFDVDDDDLALSCSVRLSLGSEGPEEEDEEEEEAFAGVPGASWLDSQLSDPKCCGYFDPLQTEAVTSQIGLITAGCQQSASSSTKQLIGLQEQQLMDEGLMRSLMCRSRPAAQNLSDVRKHERLHVS